MFKHDLNIIQWLLKKNLLISKESIKNIGQSGRGIFIIKTLISDRPVFIIGRNAVSRAGTIEEGFRTNAPRRCAENRMGNT